MFDEISLLLIKDLPQDFSNIKKAKDIKDYSELEKLLHRMHGALCYCNLPELKNKIKAVENALKLDIEKLEQYFAEFENEIVILINCRVG